MKTIIQIKKTSSGSSNGKGIPSSPIYSTAREVCHGMVTTRGITGA